MEYGVNKSSVCVVLTNPHKSGTKYANVNEVLPRSSFCQKTDN